MHSSAYLLRRNKPSKDEKPVLGTSSGETSDGDQKNAMEWALRQADAYFDRVEADQESYSTTRMLVKNPATQATMRTMQVRTSAIVRERDGSSTAKHFASARVRKSGGAVGAAGAVQVAPEW